MHERERQNLILNAVQERPVATIGELVELTATSEATIRRDISPTMPTNSGGCIASAPPRTRRSGPFNVSESGIAEAAVGLCNDGDSIIINAGTTALMMMHFLNASRLQVMTNSFPIAEHLIKHTRNNVMVRAGSSIAIRRRSSAPSRTTLP